MTTERPRIQVTLDDQTSAMLANFAERSDRSLSASAAELIREALELHEDSLLSRHADERLKRTRKWIDHGKAWS